MRIGANTAVRISLKHSVDLTCHNCARKILNVYLVDDTGTRWNNFEVIERGLSPTQELIALTVAFVFELNVLFKSVRSASYIDYHRVVDYQFGWSKWIDSLRVAAKFGDSFTHSGQVNNTWNSSEVLHNDACWSELDFSVRLSSRYPIHKSVYVILGDVSAIFGAQHILQKDLQAVRKSLRLH